jgi:hypothetical protein
MSKQNVPTQRRYPRELRERAIRMVKEAIAENGGERHGVITRVSTQIGRADDPSGTRAVVIKLFGTQAAAAFPTVSQQPYTGPRP